MRKAGCWFISFGVESGSQKIIKENFKNVDSKKAILAADICRKAGIKSMMYYILGFPNETKRDMEKTIELALEVKSDFARFFVATPLPGSKLYGISGSVPFKHLNLSDSKANMSIVSDSDLKKVIRNAYRKFYMRPSQMMRTARSFDSPRRLLLQVVAYLKPYF
jgi:radical SAM superfamily enzyme YgiQ (UPF0313 family)